MSFRGQTCQTALLLNSRFRKHTNTVRVNIYSIPSQNLYRISVIRFEQRTNSPFYSFFSLGALAIHLPLHPSIHPSIFTTFFEVVKRARTWSNKNSWLSSCQCRWFHIPCWLVGLPDLFFDAKVEISSFVWLLHR